MLHATLLDHVATCWARLAKRTQNCATWWPNARNMLHDDAPTCCVRLVWALRRRLAHLPATRDERDFTSWRHSLLSSPGSSWQKLRGRFISVIGANISCACAKTPEGLSPSAHLADGHLDLILVRHTSRLQYLRHMMRLANKADQVNRFSVGSDRPSSVWKSSGDELKNAIPPGLGATVCHFSLRVGSVAAIRSLFSYRFSQERMRYLILSWFSVTLTRLFLGVFGLFSLLFCSFLYIFII